MTVVEPMAGASRGARTKAVRAELAAFLRNRRERITPADVGLPPGPRRRTPGLRREEVAQLSGVGVTWYTWLEQGRSINASVQVLDAIARTLRLHDAERRHLHRLAGVTHEPPPGYATPETMTELHTILDTLDPLPAAIVDARYDILATNSSYEAMFSRMVDSATEGRNVLWAVLTYPDCCNPFVNRDTEVPRMVATLRGMFARHVGEPAWTGFVERLAAASPLFAKLWATHDVAEPESRVKVFRYDDVEGDISLVTTSMQIAGRPGTRIIVYTPADDASRDRIDYLRAHPRHRRHEH